MDDYIDAIIKYNGDFENILKRFNAKGEDLSQGYGIIVIPYGRLVELAFDEQVEYVELPRNLELMLTGASEGSCISEVREGVEGLTGNGILLGVIDSGIDFTHPDFIDNEGKSRILYIWDLSVDSSAPDSLCNGRQFDNEAINSCIDTGRGELSPLDELGHGTAIAGAMGGNGRASDGRFTGVAPEGEFIVVKLSPDRPILTVDIMRGVKYLTDKAVELDRPIVINISYGTSNGSHGGSSLFEAYLDSISDVGRTVITAAVGNEGDLRHHFGGRIENGETRDIEINVADELGYLYLSLWKDFVDKMDFELILPQGISTGIIEYNGGYYREKISGVSFGIDVGRPSPYSADQEIFFFARSITSTLPAGTWILRIYGRNVVDGRINIWLPVNELVGEDTYFPDSDREITVTLPSTAPTLLSIGAYDPNTNARADFSGIGYNAKGDIKPDLLAPGVNIISTRAGGGYDAYSGTSIAAPIASGASALLMEWGILKKNDPFMYGQKLKAFLRMGAERDSEISYPNRMYGYGRLCVEGSVRNAEQFINPDALDELF